MQKTLKPPFQFFGRKDYVAPLVWQFLGDVKVYCEPFGGSLAVLLGRPNYDIHSHYEIVGDINGLIVNCYRAIRAAPRTVAEILDKYNWSECDVIAAVKELKQWAASGNVNKLQASLDYYDARIAALFIGATSYLLSPTPSFTSTTNRYYATNWLLSRKDGQFVVGDDGFVRNIAIRDSLIAIANRLKYVRIFCRDWKETISIAIALARKIQQNIGVFLDPPYLPVNADNLHGDYEQIKALRDDLLQWCIEKGQQNNVRIVLTGYEEYEELAEHGWRVYNFSKQQTSLRNTAKSYDINDQHEFNRFRERIYVSPNCLDPLGFNLDDLPPIKIDVSELTLI